jgi:hypothetical protein
MEKLSITLEGQKTAFLPGESVRGQIHWALEGAPRRLDLALFWYTAGKGTRDVGVVETQRFDQPGSYGSKDFSFTIPAGPYSFSGTLISLIWAVELTCSPGSDTVRRDITVSPSGHEILLDAHGAGPHSEDTIGRLGPMGFAESHGTVLPYLR